MPEVTVFVLSVGSARTLKSALDSVAAQTIDDVEVFIVEPSEDKGRACLSGPRPGIGVVGVGEPPAPWTLAGSGTTVAFLRSDDRWPARWLEQGLVLLHGAPEKAVARSEFSTLLLRRDVLSSLGGLTEWPATRAEGRACVTRVVSRCGVTDVTETTLSPVFGVPAIPAKPESGRAAIDMVHDTLYWRARRAVTGVVHAADDALARLARGGRKRILFEAASPLSLSVFRPVLNRLRSDQLIEVWLTSADRTWSSQEIFGPAGLTERLVSASVARVMKFDGYVNTDFWNTTWLPRRTRRFHFFHGVAGKYGLDAPVQIAPVVRSFDRLMFPNMDRLRRYEAAGLIGVESAQGQLIGYPKVDCLVDGTLDRSFIEHRLGLDPARRTVLYAPTWSPHSSLHAHGIDAIRSLAAAGFNVLVKLHDRSYQTAPRAVRAGSTGEPR